MKVKCKLCENLVDEDDWVVCESCRNKAKTYENARDIGHSWEEEISLNGFWAFCFTKEDIDDILYAKFKSLPEEEQKSLIERYCEDDMLYFVRWLVKQWKEEK
jgi:hypothetical protein